MGLTVQARVAVEGESGDEGEGESEDEGEHAEQAKGWLVVLALGPTIRSRQTW